MWAGSAYHSTRITRRELRRENRDENKINQEPRGSAQGQGGHSLIFAFLIFYRVRPLTEADKKKAAQEWERFKKKTSKDVAIVGEYAHIWGTTYNGMVIVESRDLSAFHDFWHRFRETTRWYVPETRTYIAQKEE